jgi:hypothetical protein
VKNDEAESFRKDVGVEGRRREEKRRMKDEIFGFWFSKCT